MIEFTVYGVALPKGSARAFIPKGWNRPIITSATKGLKGWEAAIASTARSVCDGQLMTGSITLEITFHFPRPKSLPKRAVFHTKRPDLDKLIRGATDALTNVIWKDDAQVFSILAMKGYCVGDAAPRVVFKIAEVVKE